VPDDGAEDAGADAATADAPVEPPQQRNPGAVDPATELDQQGRQHGDRAEHRHSDHQDGAGGEGVEGGAAHHEQPGHRGDDGAAGHQDGVTGGFRGDPHRVQGGASGGAFLALALEVEQ
jgi:hypothetical protein